MVHTLEEIAQKRANVEDKKEIKTKKKEKKNKNRLSFPIKTTLHSLKPLLLNFPALSVKVLNKLSNK